MKRSANTHDSEYSPVLGITTVTHRDSLNLLKKENVEMVRVLRRTLTIPTAINLSPFHTSLPHFAAALQEAGADGLVLFNRFFEPDIDMRILQTWVPE